MPTTSPGGCRRFALLQRSLSSAEMNVPRGRGTDRQTETETEVLVDDDVAYLLVGTIIIDSLTNHREYAARQDNNTNKLHTAGSSLKS